MRCVGDGGGLDRGGALDQDRGPGSGPATPESLRVNNAHREAGPIEPGRAKARGAGHWQGKLSGARREKKARREGDTHSGQTDERGAHQA